MSAVNLEKQYHEKLVELKALREKVLVDANILKAYDVLVETIERMKAQKVSCQILNLAIEPAIQLLSGKMGTKHYNKLADDVSRVNFVGPKEQSIWATSLYYLSWAVFILSVASMLSFGPIGFVLGLVGVIGSYFINDISYKHANIDEPVNLGQTMKGLSNSGNTFFKPEDAAANDEPKPQTEDEQKIESTESSAQL